MYVKLLFKVAIYFNRYQKHLGLPVNADNRSAKDNGLITVPNNFNLANQVGKVTVGGHSQIPEFQISVPEPFQINQLNFYTEVNPSVSNQPTSNFARTANIDEDYDT